MNTLKHGGNWLAVGVLGTALAAAALAGCTSDKNAVPTPNHTPKPTPAGCITLFQQFTTAERESHVVVATGVKLRVAGKLRTVTYLFGDGTGLTRPANIQAPHTYNAPEGKTSSFTIQAIAQVAQGERLESVHCEPVDYVVERDGNVKLESTS